MKNEKENTENPQYYKTGFIYRFIIEKESIKFAKWCMLKKYCGRGYNWENVELLYEIYNDERKNNPNMDL